MGQFLFEFVVVPWHIFIAIPSLLVSLLMNWLANMAGTIALFAVTIIGFAMITRGALRLVSRPIFGCLSRLIIPLAIMLFLLSFFYVYGRDPQTRVTALGNRLINNADVPGSLKEQYGGKESIFLSAPVSADRHHYLALNLVHCPGTTPYDLKAGVSRDLNRVFPLSSLGHDDNVVRKGAVIVLGRTGNPVTVVAVNDHCFVLRAEPGHFLQGTATHGFVRDGSGDLWLFQYGEGPNPALDKLREPAYKQLLNYRLADVMWARMATNVTNCFGTHVVHSKGPFAGKGGGFGGGGAGGRW